MSTDLYCLECQEDTYFAYPTNGTAGWTTSAWYTFECFVRLESKPANSQIVVHYCRQNWESTFAFKITSSQVYLVWEADDDTGYSNYYSDSVPTGTWFHFVFKLDSGDSYFRLRRGEPGDTYPGDYTISAEEEDTGSATGFKALYATTNKQAYGIGADINGTSNADARICDLRYWSDERTNAELGPESGGGYNDRQCPESAPAGGVHYIKLNRAGADQEDHWGGASGLHDVPGTYGSFAYDDSPFEAGASPQTANAGVATCSSVAVTAVAVPGATTAIAGIAACSSVAVTSTAVPGVATAQAGIATCSSVAVTAVAVPGAATAQAGVATCSSVAVTAVALPGATTAQAGVASCQAVAVTAVCISGQTAQAGVATCQATAVTATAVPGATTAQAGVATCQVIAVTAVAVPGAAIAQAGVATCQAVAVTATAFVGGGGLVEELEEDDVTLVLVEADAVMLQLQEQDAVALVLTEADQATLPVGE